MCIWYAPKIKCLRPVTNWLVVLVVGGCVCVSLWLLWLLFFRWNVVWRACTRESIYHKIIFSFWVVINSIEVHSHDFKRIHCTPLSTGAQTVPIALSTARTDYHFSIVVCIRQIVPPQPTRTHWHLLSACRLSVVCAQTVDFISITAHQRQSQMVCKSKRI